MVATVTESRLTPDQMIEVEKFLSGFLPRVRRQPGVAEILHFTDESTGTSTTVILWEDAAAVAGYRQSELIQEPMAFEQRLGLTSRRAGPCPVTRL